MAPPQVPDPIANGTESSPQGSWREWARHVLIELERASAFSETVTIRIQEMHNDMEQRISQLRTEIQLANQVSREGFAKDIADLRLQVGLLQLKSGIWGAVGAAVPILIAVLIYYLTNHTISHKTP